MPTLTPIIDVTVSLSALPQTVGPDLTVPLVLFEADAATIAALGSDVTALITPDDWVAQLAALELTSADPIYDWIETAVGQAGNDGVPRRIVIGAMDTSAWTQLERTITITTEADGVWSGTINGQPFSFTASGSATPGAIATGIAGAINGLTITLTPVTATDSTNTVAVEADEAGEDFDLTLTAPAGGEATIAVTNALVGPAEDLTGILAERSDWYSVWSSQDDPGVSYSLCAGFASQTWGRRIFLPRLHDTVAASAAAGAGYDLADRMRELANGRVSVWYDPADGQDVDAAACGMNIMRQRTTAVVPFRTWANIPVTGVSGWTPTSTQITNLDGKRANYAAKRTDSLVATYSGRMADAQFIDARIAADDLAYYLEGQLLNVLTAAEPPPYNAQGRQVLTNLIEGWIRSRPYVDNEQPVVVTVPAKSTLPAGDQTLRLWTGITFSCFLNGAVHGVQISGEVTG